MSAGKRVAIVDYGSGNLRSVRKAFAACGADARLAPSPAELGGADALVVPGVGAFGDCASNLRSAGLWQPILDWVRDGRPYFGICLGYQLLFEGSEESPGTSGFGLLSGVVRRFAKGGLKVPHMGWNSLEITRPDDRLYNGLAPGPSVYFVHSYFPVPADSACVTAACEYGESFAASITSANVTATQYHPEKSQAAGLAILRNFLDSL